MNKIDPICGMQGTIHQHNHWFCSQHCVKIFEEQEGLDTETPTSSSPKKDNKRIAYVLIAVILLGGIFSWRFGVIREFMGAFFVLVAILKLLDHKGFVTAYAKYDLIAMRYSSWGWIYPYIELAIGVGFLLGLYIEIIAGLTLVLMSIGTIGVSKKLMKKEKFACACLGTKLNVPLTNLTLVEDILMAIMSVMLLLG